MAVEKKKEDSKNITDRQKALELALAQIEKQFGKGAIMKLGGQAKVDVEAIPTGALTLDWALGVGGLPRGRVIEIFGREASGKTTLTLSVIREIQKKGGVAAFIDAEHAFDATYAKKIGLNLDELLISQPDTGEQALEIVETLVRSNAVDLVVIDSVAALTPRAEIEGDMGQAHMGLQARLMSQALRKLTAAISKSHTCVVFINQIREKIGVMFGSPETTPGGRALKFYSSVRLDLRRIASIKSGDEIIGGRVKARVVKNKVAPPFKEAEFEILHDEGIAKTTSVLEAGINSGIIQKSGTWLSFKNEKLGQGKDMAVKLLKEKPKLQEEIEKEVRKGSI
ncbi:MAG: recombinase RecA [Candidatus Omnitrophica bacterium]|nr:recombinase RecA [Candidatus Omnitrophota bacterium]MBU4345904.1 recombinase RecA [Candidatus Omnitrophota bacterium]MBU4473080.1 recombinase RecA [Candidatus Omnitrophota bacterium]MCG2706670.1 recombinase RecA [Candidatus Omnitrophota bacterium]